MRILALPLSLVLCLLTFSMSASADTIDIESYLQGLSDGFESAAMAGCEKDLEDDGAGSDCTCTASGASASCVCSGSGTNKVCQCSDGDGTTYCYFCRGQNHTQCECGPTNNSMGTCKKVTAISADSTAKHSSGAYELR